MIEKKVIESKNETKFKFTDGETVESVKTKNTSANRQQRS